MSPRPYHSEQRRAAASQTRTRIVDAARALLASEGGLAAFSVDAVAREAGVARMTVYYQFRSRLGLLEALFDDLAQRGGMSGLPAAFSTRDPLEALDGLIATFCRFWESDRLLLRRLRAAATADPELEPALRARDERRRMALRPLLDRLALPDLVDLLWTLTSFETYDALAGSRPVDEVAALLSRTARTIVAGSRSTP